MPDLEGYSSYDSCWSPFEVRVTVDYDEVTASNEHSRTISTNPTRSDTIPEGAFTPEDAKDPERYLEKLIPLYKNDIIRSRKEQEEKRGRKINFSRTVDEEARRQAEKAVRGHSEFTKILKEKGGLKPSSKVLSPGSGLGHEQAVSPDLDWTGLEFQEKSVSLADQKNKQLGLNRAKNYQWSFFNSENLDDGTIKELGPGWEEKLNDWNDLGKDKTGEIPDAIYMKHACGGITDGTLKKAVEKKVPLIFIASCCADRYRAVSHKVIAPHMSFEDYEQLAKTSQNKQSKKGEEAVKKINDLRMEYLKKHGYQVNSGETSHGPYVIGKLPSAITKKASVSYYLRKFAQILSDDSL